MTFASLMRKMFTNAIRSLYFRFFQRIRHSMSCFLSPFDVQRVAIAGLPARAVAGALQTRRMLTSALLVFRPRWLATLALLASMLGTGGGTLSVTAHLRTNVS